MGPMAHVNGSNGVNGVNGHTNGNMNGNVKVNGVAKTNGALSNGTTGNHADGLWKTLGNGTNRKR